MRHRSSTAVQTRWRWFSIQAAILGAKTVRKTTSLFLTAEPELLLAAHLAVIVSGLHLE